MSSSSDHDSLPPPDEGTDPLTDAPASATPLTLERGSTLGRYLVLERLGAGGMGVVFAAYDVDLDRKLALKLLHPRDDGGSSGSSEEARARLVREAQALAKISHRNVITVYEVGTYQDRVYLASEYVDGAPVSQWLEERERPFRDVLDVFLAAGRGLAAAHAGGIVHRDFKPANVLLAKDGEVKVVDFGLARRIRDEAPVATGDPSPASPLDDDLTNTGTVLGTPAFMAPEQHSGGAVDARSDQFSYCVSLWRALYRAAPFSAKTRAELVAAMTEGRFAAVRDGEVPARIRAILTRGLRASPDDRYPTMDALLDDLEAAARPRRLAWPLVATGAIGIAAAVFALRARSAPDLCGGAEEKIASAWSAERARSVRAAFAKSDKAFVAPAERAVEERLDKYSAAWSGMYTDACKATRVRGDQSADLLDLRMACLDEHKQAMSALVDVFANADAAVIGRAVTAVDALPSLERCADAAALRAPLRPPSSVQRGEVERVRGILSAASALRAGGKFADGLARAREGLAAARALSYAPLTAEAAHTTGVLEADAGDPRTAVTTLSDAARDAAEGHHDRVETETLIDLARIYADKLQEYDKAWAFVQPAEWSLARYGSDPALEARAIEAQAFILEGRGKHADAAPYYEKGLALAEKVYGAKSIAAARALIALGENRRLSHKYDDAMVLYRRALEIYEATLGPEHPDVGLTLHDMCSALIDGGRRDEARPLCERALAVRRASLGPAHPDTARALSNLATLSIEQGRRDEAFAYATEALAAKEAALGPEHPNVAFTLVLLAELESDRGHLDQALAHAERSLAIRDKALGPEHALVIESLVAVGHLRLDRHEPREAIAPLERAAAAVEKIASDPAQQGWTRYALGRALWESNVDRARATSLLKTAWADLVRSGDRGSEPREEMDQWLAKSHAPAK